MKTVCMFCMKSHTKKPKLCDAKSKVMRAYLYQGLQLWQVMQFITLKRGVKNEIYTWTLGG